MPPTFFHRGERFDRVTILFKRGASACQARSFVQDVLHRAHGFKTAKRLTDELARGGGRFRVAIARRVVGRLKRRLKLLIEAGLIRLFVAGRLVEI
jgi:hypothetical protein